MAIAKRIFFFVLVNIAVMFTINIIINVFGLNEYFGTGTQGLLMMCLLWGMVGSFISLWMSKWMAKSMMGVQIISPTSSDPQARALVERVHQLSRKAGLPKMPEVGFYQSDEVNAFATGPSKSSSLVAVSTGLLNRMRDDEVEGVLGHEVAHIANGDMVTMTLVQGVVNSFVMFFSYIVANFLVRGDDEDGGGGNFFMEFMLRQVLMIAFGLLATPIVAGFSRWREFRADAGGAKIAGRDKMIAALQALRSTTDHVDDTQKQFSALKISGRDLGPIARLFMTHPPLEARISRLSRGH